MGKVLETTLVTFIYYESSPVFEMCFAYSDEGIKLYYFM